MGSCFPTTWVVALKFGPIDYDHVDYARHPTISSHVNRKQIKLPQTYLCYLFQCHAKFTKLQNNYNNGKELPEEDPDRKMFKLKPKLLLFPCFTYEHS